MTQQNTPPSARLRSRFPWFALSMVLGLGAGVACYLGQRPVFQSSGVIEIKPTLPKIFDSSRDKTIPNYDQFMDVQVRRVLSRRTVDMAMERSRWQDLHRGNGDQAVADFMQHLTAFRSGQVIEINYADPDPKVAAIAVDSMVRAYMSLFGEYTDGDDAVRIDALNQVRQSAETDIQKATNSIKAFADPLTPEALRQMYEAKISELTKAEADTHRADLNLKIAEESRRPAAAAIMWTPEKIADRDLTMKDMLAERGNLQTKIDQLSLHVEDRNSAMQTARADLKRQEEKIALYMKKYQENYTDGAQRMEAAGVVAMPGESSGTTSYVTLDELRTRATQYRDAFERIHSDAVELGRKCQEIKSLEVQRDKSQNILDEAKKNLDSLSVESRVGGHLSIVSYGEIPLTPFNDRRVRHASLAGITAMLGTLILGGLMKMAFRKRPA